MMAKRLWLIFAQAVTVILAGYFVLNTLKPNWLGNTHKVNSVTIKESTDNEPVTPGSYRDAVKKSMPAIVNVFSSKSEKPGPAQIPMVRDPSLSKNHLQTIKKNGLISFLVIRMVQVDNPRMRVLSLVPVQEC